MNPEALVFVYEPEDYFEASLIKNALEESGIPCHLEGENATASITGGGLTSNVGRWKMRIMTKAKDAERAKQIINSTDWPTYTQKTKREEEND
jgi:hypothetical protein